MNCGDLNESYELYVLGLLDGVELEELQEHLDRNCTTCMDEIDRAVHQTASVLAAVPKLEPSPKLRARVLAGFGIETRPFWFRFAPLAAAVCAMLALIALALPLMRKAPDSTNASAVEWLNTPGVRQFSFGKQESGPRGSVLVSREKGVMLIVANLPEAPTGKMYETWIIPETGTPRPTGRLVSTEGVYTGAISGPVEPAKVKAVAVSLEAANSFPRTPATVVFAAPVQ